MENPDMTRITMISPAAICQSRDSAQWAEINGIEVPIRFASDEIERSRKHILGVTDVSCFERFGVKGPQAAQWLADHELAIPAQHNVWTLSTQKTLVMRLGSSEFLIEDQSGGVSCESLNNDILRVPGVYKVPRADAAFILSGAEVDNLFSEVCSLDLRDKPLSEKGVVMTQVAGISVIVISHDIAGNKVYRVWCDGTYGHYLWETLLELAVELGGGPVGLAQY